MAKKRPSLRNYLVQGDQVRDINTPENPPLPDASLPGRACELLSLCPTETLDMATWGTALACLLLGEGDDGARRSGLAEAFPREPSADLERRLDRMVELGILKQSGEKLTLVPPDLWKSPSSDWTDGFLDSLSPEDRDMWHPVLPGAKLEPLSLDKVKEAFETSDSSSDQFFLMRKIGQPLVPATRSSQIRTPLEAVILWSEKGRSMVFWDVPQKNGD